MLPGLGPGGTVGPSDHPARHGQGTDNCAAHHPLPASPVLGCASSLAAPPLVAHGARRPRRDHAARSQPAVRRAVTGPAAAPPARRRPPSGRPPWHDGPRQAVQPSSRLVAAAVRPAGAVLGVSWHPLGQSPGWRRAGRCGRGPRPLHQARSTRFPTCQASTRPAAPRPRRAPPARPRCAAGPPQRPFPVRVGQCAEPFKAEDVSISQSCGLCRRLKGVENAKHNDRGFGMCLSSVRHCLHDKSIARCRSNSGGRANPSNPSSCRLDHRSSASILVAIME